jgi:hypothetical protein
MRGSVPRRPQSRQLRAVGIGPKELRGEKALAGISLRRCVIEHTEWPIASDCGMDTRGTGKHAMTYTKSAKKNDTIEIRLPDETKAAFMERCRQDGRTASEAVRTFIDEHLAPHSSVRRRRPSFLRIGVAGIVGAVLGVGVAAPSMANSAHNTRSAFETLDRDRDGALTYEEFRLR